MGDPVGRLMEVEAKQPALLPPRPMIPQLLDEDIRFLSGSKSPIPEDQATRLNKLLSLLGAKVPDTVLKGFLGGERQILAGSFTRNLNFSKDAKKNLALFLKKYDVVLTKPADTQEFLAGQVVLIEGKTERKVSEDDVLRLRRMGIFVEVTDYGKCYIRSSAGLLLQELETQGIEVSLMPGSSFIAFNKFYFPSMPQGVVSELRNGLQKARELALAGKHSEAFYMHNLFLNTVSAYRQLEVLQALKETASNANVNIRREDFEGLLKSKQAGSEGFKKVFGVSFQDFLRLGTLGNFVQYKLGLAEYVLRESAKTYLECMAVFSKPSASAGEIEAAMEKWRKQSSIDSIAQRLAGEARTTLSICRLIRENRESHSAWVVNAEAREVKGKEARRVINELAIETGARVRKYFYAIESEYKNMLFFSLAGTSAAMAGKDSSAEYCGMQLGRSERKIALARKAIIGESNELNILMERATSFEQGVEELLAALDKTRGREARLIPFEKKTLELLRSSFITALRDEHSLHFERREGENEWDVLRQVLREHLLNNYNPRTVLLEQEDHFEYNQRDSIGKVCLLARSRLAEMRGVTWRLEEDKTYVKKFGIAFIRYVHTQLKERQRELELNFPKGNPELIRSIVDGFAGIADALESEKIDMSEAARRYALLLDIYGRNVFSVTIKDARKKLAEIKEVFGDKRFLSEPEQNLIKLLFRGFDPDKDFSLSDAEKLLNKAKYDPQSFFNMYGKRFGERFTCTESQRALFLADLVNGIYDLSWNARYQTTFTMWGPKRTKETEQEFFTQSQRAFRLTEIMIPEDKKPEFRKVLEWQKQKRPSATAEELPMRLHNSSQEYKAYAAKLYNAIEDAGFEESMRKIESGWTRYQYRTMRFLQKNLDGIMDAALMVGVVAGLFDSGGLASAPQGIAARKAVGTGAKLLFRKFGWEMMSKTIQRTAATKTTAKVVETTFRRKVVGQAVRKSADAKRIAKVAAASAAKKEAELSLRYLARSGMAGVSVAGTGVMVAAGVPMVGAAINYFRGGKTKAESKMLFEQGLNFAFLGLLATYGPAARRVGTSRWLRPIATGRHLISDGFLVGATSVKLGMILDRYAEGRKLVQELERKGAKPEEIKKVKESYYPGGVGAATMGMDLLYATIGGYGIFKTLRGTVMAKTAGAKMVFSEKVLKGDIFVVGLYQSEPYLAPLLIPEKARKEMEAQMIPTRKGMPEILPRPVDYREMGIIPEEVQLPEDICGSMLEAIVKPSALKKEGKPK